MGRLWRIITGWWLRVVGKAEDASPEAVLAAEQAEFTKAQAQFNDGLAKQAGIIERLKVQVENEDKRAIILGDRAKAAYASGQMEKAGQLALELKELKRELDENKTQLQQAEDMFQTLKKQRDAYITTAQQRLAAVKSKISKLKMAESQAKLAEMASSVTFNPDGTGLAEFESRIDERLADAKGKVRVAGADLKLEMAPNEAELKAMEGQALAEFAREMGLAGPASSPAPIAPQAGRDLGPAEAAPDATKVAT